MATKKYKLLIHSARQLVTISSKFKSVMIGEEMREISIYEKNERGSLTLVVSGNGTIHDLGYESEILKKYKKEDFETVLDASDMCLIPGLVDGHTHPVWAGDRVNEFAMKLAGATYLEVHKAGGGINFTVEHTKRASEDELYETFHKRLSMMLQCGTTLAECKSGYGLDLDTELKMLRVIERARTNHSVEVSSTYCGAHAIPKGKTSDEALNDILSNHIPKLKEEIGNKRIKVDNIDVFCEKGIFEVEQSRKILKAGKDIGLNVNFHGDELNPIKSAEMGAEIGALAISHLEEISAEGIDAMAKSGSIAVILPTTAYILRLKPPPVRKMIDSGVAVALGSDFNPNAYCLSMPMVMHLACVNLHMTMDEALCAATINAAASLGKSKTHGSLEVGKIADILILNCNRWEHLIYQMGNHNNIIKYVIKKGDVVHTNQT